MRGTAKQFDRQLKALDRRGVKYDVLGDEECGELLCQVATDFVDANFCEGFVMNVARAVTRQAPVDYDQLLRLDRRIEPPVDLFHWLTQGQERCHRFDRHAYFPVLSIVVASLDSGFATSWPGLLVSFPRRRALAVNLDNERIGCDLVKAK